MKKIAFISLLMTMTFLPTVYGKSCGDIIWSPDITQKIPSISMACLEIQERNGQDVAVIKADFIRMSAMNNIVLDFHLSDGNKERFTGPSNGLKVNGDIPFNRLPRGYELSLYVPAGERFTFFEIKADITEDKLVEARTLPKTASIMPTLGFIGTIFILLGVAIRIKRSRHG